MRLPPHRRRPLAAACAALALIAMTQEATAADLSSEEVDAHYEAISSALAQGENAASLWWYAWGGGLAALTLGEGTVALLTRDPATRIDAIVGMSASALGVGAILLSSRAAFAYRGRLALMDASTPEARLARLREAERILDAAADDEALGHSLLAHLAGDAETLAASSVLWAGYHHYATGWLNLIGGTVVTELLILSRPTAAIEARRAYRAGRLAAPAASFTWTFQPASGGLELRGTF